MASISTIIPVYNAENEICSSLDSALSQTFPVSEIIVINDGSTDNTEKVINEYIESNRSAIPNIRYIKQKNKGPASARNNGIRHASGKFIAFLDSDDQWLPDKIEKQISKFESNSQLVLVHCGRIRVDLNGKTSIQKNTTIPEGRVFNDLIVKNHICCSSVMVKKSCISRLGGFDESPEIHRSEDYDLWLRIAVDHEFGYINEPLVKYLVNPGGLNRSNISCTYKAMATVFNKALKNYDGDRDNLKRQWMITMLCNKGRSFIYVNDYRRGILSFIESLKYGYECMTSIAYEAWCRILEKNGVK